MPTLEQTLVDILNKTTALMEQGFNFAEDQLPDIIYQLLLWYGVYNFLLFLSVIPVLYVGYWTIKWLWTSDKADQDIFSTFSTIVITFFTAILVWHLINLTWLKIWIAPKIWLIEYTASLMKGS